MKTEVKLPELDTYVLIDVSNIRSSCLKSCNFRIDFTMLMSYLKKKYPNLKIVNYYEGMARGDNEKRKEFCQLQKIGYAIKTIQRRAYIDEAILKNFYCKKCNYRNRIMVLPKNRKLKSNVDVYLATEMLEIAFAATKPIHIILFSCDGDYTEAIKSATKNSNVYVTVVATPTIHDYEKNTLSVRLKELRKIISKQYQLSNIMNIKDDISKPCC